MKAYRKPLFICFLCLVLCVGVMFGIKTLYFSDLKLLNPLKNAVGANSDNTNNAVIPAVTKAVANNEDESNKTNYFSDGEYSEELETFVEDIPDYFSPDIVDDGSIIFDGMTVTELADKLNRSLKSNLSNTGYYFADFTRRYGVDPYLLVAVTFIEAGCNNVCATSMASANNYVGMLYNGRLLRYDTVEKGLNAYFNLVYNYYWKDGRKDVYSFSKKWNPSHCTDSSCPYGDRLNNFYQSVKNA